MNQMRITVLGAGHIGSTVGRLWHAAGHEVTFAARDATGPRALAEELGERAHAATVAEGVAAAAVLVAVPGPAVVDVLTAAGGLDGRVVIDAANMMGQDRLSLRQLADAFPQARWARAFNTLQARVLAEENHRQPRWVLFLSGDEKAKPAAARLIADAGFEPVDLGGIDDSQLQEPGSALWNATLEVHDAKALAGRIRAGQVAAADPLTEP
jgi:8-hydroxy-5-deazaflavin:NADPH oxidoreductase